MICLLSSKNAGKVRICKLTTSLRCLFWVYSVFVATFSAANPVPDHHRPPVEPSPPKTVAPSTLMPSVAPVPFQKPHNPRRTPPFTTEYSASPPVACQGLSTSMHRLAFTCFSRRGLAAPGKGPARRAENKKLRSHHDTRSGPNDFCENT